jgi:hypothetical protein
MGEEKGTSLTRREFEAVIKRASELSTSDPDGGEGALDEGELFRIAREVGLPDAHVRRALAELRTADDPQGLVARWFGSLTVRVSRVVPGDRERLRVILDEFLVAGHLLQPVRHGSDVLLYRPAVDWISNFARAGASMSQTVYWASAKEIEVRLKEVDEDTTLIEIDVDPGVRSDYTAGAVMGGLGAGGAVSFGVAAFLGTALAVPMTGAWSLGIILGGAVALGVVRVTGHHSRKRREQVQQELEGILDRLERGEDLSPPPASWRRWVTRQARRFKLELSGDDLDF